MGRYILGWSTNTKIIKGFNIHQVRSHTAFAAEKCFFTVALDLRNSSSPSTGAGLPLYNHTFNITSAHGKADCEDIPVEGEVSIGHEWDADYFD